MIDTNLDVKLKITPVKKKIFSESLIIFNKNEKIA